MKISFNSKKIEKKILARAKRAKESKKFLTKAAKLWQRNVKADTAKGRSYTGMKFPSISSRWAERRDRLLSVNRKSPFYRYGKSNASFMGDTIKAIKAKPFGGKLQLYVEGKHKKVKGIRGKYLKGSSADIADIIRGLRSNGIHIMGVSKLVKKLIKQEFIREFRRTK